MCRKAISVTHGLGIRVQDIWPKDDAEVRFKKLFSMSPKTLAFVEEWLKENGPFENPYEVAARDFENIYEKQPLQKHYDSFAGDHADGLAELMSMIICDQEDGIFISVKDHDGDTYLLYPPLYSFDLTSHPERMLSKKEAEDIIKKYAGVLTDKDVKVTFYAVES